MGSKIISLILVLIFSISIVSAESEKPTATFSADVTEGYAPLKVHFTSETTGDPTSYFWVFEPQTSSDWNSHHAVTASHTFQNPGVYDISLTVTNSAGSSSVTEPLYITVLASPTDTSTDTPTDTSTDMSSDISSDTPTDMPTDTPTAEQTDTPTDKPTATFSADVTEGYAPLKVHFTSATSGDPTSYFWVFEPQSNSDWNSHHAETASHTFQNPGVYDVSLTVTNSAGSSSVTEPHYITVLASPTDTPTDASKDSQTNSQTPTLTDTQTPAQTNKPTATFSADVTEGYAPLKVHFTSATSGDPTSYFWVFEPQSNSDWNSHHAETASHTFQNPGVYDVSLTVTNSSGDFLVTEPHYITVLASPMDTSTPTPNPTLTQTPTPMNTPTQKPVASFIADVTSGNAPFAVTFTDTSTGGVPKSRNWNFGDSFYSEDGPIITHTFTKPGTYTVTLTVTNDAGSDTVCKNNFVIVTKAPADQSGPTSEPTPATTASQPISANINLHSTKTAVYVGEEMHNTLSVVNLIDKPVMHAQVILIPPSGTSVTSSQFVQSGGGQYTATYDINPGTGKDIEVSMVANQAGNFNVEARVRYYFGNNNKNVEDYPLDLPIQAADSKPTVTPTLAPQNEFHHIPDLGAVSLVLILMTAFILKRDKK